MMFDFLTNRLSRPRPATKSNISMYATKSTTQLRGFKLCNISRTRKFGVAANSLQMLSEKASLKLHIDNPRIYVAQDGTEVTDEEYFATLDAQTLFVIAGLDEIVQTDFELMCETIQSSVNLIEQGKIIRSFLKENATQESISKLFNLEKKLESQADSLLLSSSREEHPSWFIGQPDSIDSKEKLMRRRSQDRIRGYFYKTKDILIKSSIYKSSKEARFLINTILDIFQLLLQEVDFFKTYFDRECPKRHSTLVDEDTTDGESPKKKIRKNIQSICQQHNVLDRLCVALCNARGDFRCQGVWSDKACQYSDHTINPYESRESAVLFQIWNLDHQVEISRTIIPSLLKSVEDFVADSSPRCEKHRRSACMLSIVQYFYEIFTVDNLKLVHIVCHDKGVHPLESTGGSVCDRCDEYAILKKILKVMETKIV